MRNYVIIFLLSISIARADVVNLSINAQKHEKASLLLAFIGAPNPQNEIMRPLVKKALEFTHQLQVDAIAVPAIMSKQEALHKAERHFSQLKKLVEQAIDEGWRVDQLERTTFTEMLDMGYSLLTAFVAAQGDGDQGAQMEQAGKTLQRLNEPHEQRSSSSLPGMPST